MFGGDVNLIVVLLSLPLQLQLAWRKPHHLSIHCPMCPVKLAVLPWIGSVLSVEQTWMFVDLLPIFLKSSIPVKVMFCGLLQLSVVKYSWVEPRQPSLSCRK